MRDRKFVGIASKSAFEGSRVRDGYVQTTGIQKPDISSKPQSEISDVHIIDVPNQSISTISRISTTYQNFPNSENSGPTNTQIIDNAARTGVLAQLPSSETPLPLIAKYTESDKIIAAALQNNNTSKATIYVDQEGDPVVDPTLMIVAGNGHITYICPSCRSYVTDEPNKLCSKCRNGGVQVDVKTIQVLAENAATVDKKYPKEIREKVTAVQLEIVKKWPGKSQAFAWAGRIAQMLVGVSPKNSGEFYTYRFQQPVTPTEISGFADWWKANKLDYSKKTIDMPTAPEALERFFSEYREYVQNAAKRKAEGTRKYIEVDMSEYK
jgi:deoxycytidylate deaminase